MPAAAGLAAPVVPAVPFQDRLAAAGYASMHKTCRPPQEMVELVLNKAKTTKRVVPYLDTRLLPCKNPQWTKDKDEVERVTARAAEMANDLGQPGVG